jgi:hypothetical protein
MVTASINDNDLVLEVQGVHKVLSFRSRLVIPLTHVCGITAHADVMEIPRGVRAPGTSIPGFIHAGTFHSQGDKMFWDVHDPAKAIVIELADDDFARLVVEVEDPDETVGLIERALTSGR